MNNSSTPPNLARRSSAARLRLDRAFMLCSVAASTVAVLILVVLLGSILIQGLEYLTWQFLQNPPSRRPNRAGVHPAMMGTLWISAVCALTAVPIGVSTAILLEEFRPRGVWLRRIHGFIQLNITNLAGVPSIVYGIIGLTVFVKMFAMTGTSHEPLWTLGDPDAWYYMQLPFGRSVLAGGLTLMLVVLPVIIIASQEALRAVPNSLRQGAMALGATRCQMVWNTT